MSVRILLGDVREHLRDIPDGSVHCAVTSPPYFGLRDYGMPGQIGLEATPAAFVETMVEVFREVRRVLRDDGTLWLNLGDSYAGGGGHSPNAPSSATSKSGKYGEALKQGGIKPSGLIKQKDLIGIPWRVAFALQADGWYLRQDIIWAKPNPMPESVTDRCTKAHEYLFLMSKSPRYFYDAEAIAEALAETSVSRLAQNVEAQAGSDRVPGKTNGAMKAVSGAYGHGAGRNDGDRPPSGGWATGETKRNRRSVWTVATQPFKEAHFATFPPALIEPCIKAGCPKDCCAKCGAPVVREVERTPADVKSPASDYGNGAGRNDGGRSQLVGASTKTLGWSPSCSCDAGLARGVCLDPFGGAGTTGLVADRLGRDAILIELNPDYAAIARRRIDGDAPLFAPVAA